jgi:hypothetical protein
VKRRALFAAVLVAAAAGAGPGTATARPTDDMLMVGNMAPYPDVAAVPRADRRRGRRLLRKSRAARHRFDTPAKARRLGYVPDPAPPRRPGFTHFRKHGWHFWGRVFDARNPQSVIFWCPTRGGCTLAAYMYRAPAGMAPSTWGDLLQWHRHGRHPDESWMTHVWLVPHLREAFATCAPIPALVRRLGIREERYDIHTGHLSACRKM